MAFLTRPEPFQHRTTSKCEWGKPHRAQLLDEKVQILMAAE